MTLALFVNSDGTTERREAGGYRVVDYDRGKVWSQTQEASDGIQHLIVYVEIPWSSFSGRTPKEEREAQEQYRKAAKA